MKMIRPRSNRAKWLFARDNDCDGQYSPFVPKILFRTWVYMTVKWGKV